jgi:glyoxylase-like metal-dependent hydrolase (beta-lactamase superfamily II)
MQIRKLPLLAIVVLTFLVIASLLIAQTRPAAPTSVRLYILDCGTIGAMNPGRLQLEAGGDQGLAGLHYPLLPCRTSKGHADVGRGTDTGCEIPGKWRYGEAGVFTSTQKLLPQLAALGYKPADITFMAMSHYHSDHTANANEFAGSTWIVQEAERAAMFGATAPRMAQVANFSKLKDAKTIVVPNGDHDVFGDGTVVLKSTPGHTPGHQSLFLKFAKRGPVVLAGDLYHYPEERSLDRIPTFEASQDQTRQSRKAMEEFLKKSGSQLWIQHEIALQAKLRRPRSS